MEFRKSLVLIFVVLLVSSLVTTSTLACNSVRSPHYCSEGEQMLDDDDLFIEITSPDDGAVLETPDVTVEWESGGLGPGGAHLATLYMDGQQIDERVLGSGATEHTFEGLENNQYRVEMAAATEEQDAEFDEVNFEVDAPRPSITITEPEDGEIFEVPYVTVEWESENAAFHEVRLDGGEWIDVGLDTSYTFDGLEDGQYTAEVMVESDLGITVSDEVNFEVEINVPQVDITSPESGEIFGEDTVTVEWDSDNTAYHEVRLDGGNWEDVGPDTSHTFQGLDDGERIVEIRASDDAGYFQDTDSVTFIVDTIPPGIEITSPEPGEIFTTDSVTVEWDTTIEITDIKEYRVRINRGEWIDLDHYRHEFSDLDEGEHDVDVEAIDEAGNRASAEVSFIVDTEPPSIDIISPSEGATQNVDHVIVRWRGRDDGTGIERYAIRIQRKIHRDFEDIGTRTEYTFRDLVDGEYTVSIRAWDGVGHQQTETVSFQVDAGEDFSVDITEPKEDETVTTVPELTARWTSQGADHYQVRLDGGWQDVDGEEYTFTDLSEGEHTLTVRAVHSNGWESEEYGGWVVEDEVTFNLLEEGETMSISLRGEPYLVWVLLGIVILNVALIMHITFNKE